VNKLEVVKFLIHEIEEEENALEAYHLDTKQAIEKSNKSGGSIWQYRKFFDLIPSKTKIKADCLKIRQLMLEVSKEVN